MNDNNEMQEGSSKRYGWMTDLLVVAFLVSVKAFLIWPAIGNWSLYRDDAWQSLAVHVATWKEVVLSGATAPGFAVILNLWSSLAGVSTVALQLPAFVCGLAGPVVCYGLSRRLGTSRTTAVVAATWLCGSAVHSEYSARVKPYSFDALMAMVLMYLAVELSDNSESRRRWTGLIILSFIAFTISSTAGIAGAALVGVSGLLLAIPPRHRLAAQQMAAIGGLGVFGVAAASWTWFALSVRNNAALCEFWENQLITPGAGISAVFTQLADRIHQSLVVLSPFPGQPIIQLATIVMLMLGVVAGYRWLKFGHWLLLLAIPVSAAVLAASGRIPLGGGRSDLYLAPAYVLLSTATIEWCLRSFNQKAVLWTIRISAVLVLAVVLLRGQAKYPAEDVRQLTSDVLQKIGPKDKVIVYPETSYMVACYAGIPMKLQPDELAMTGYTPAVDDDRFLLLPGFETGQQGPVYRRAMQRVVELVKESITETPPRIWVVSSQLFPVSLEAIDNTLIDANYVPAEVLEATNANARVWQRAVGD